jgi:glucose/arabinose dehydrogenase
MRSIALVATLVIALPVLARAGTPEPGFTDTLVIGSLSQPTALAFLPDGRMLVTEKGGDLVRVDGGVPTTLATIPVCAGSEMGLLGVAIDPAFSTNGFVYLYRTKPPVGGCGSSTGRFNQVVRVTVSGDTAGSLTELLTGIATDGGNHDGGVLRIGPDQKLYVGAGDSGIGDNQGGPGSSTNPYAQDLGSLNGKLLRLNLDGTVPGDNPLVSTVGARGEVWAYGFRNPFRMTFDDATGKLWIGDVGDLTVEEFDVGVAGGNYSWPRCEGDLQGPPSAPTACVYGTDVAPVFTYPHGGGDSLGTCVIGGAFAGGAFAAMAGDYVFGDCTSSDVYIVPLNGTRDGFGGTPALVSSSAGTPSDFVAGPDGAVYYAAVGDGAVRRLAAASTSPGDELLSGRALALKDDAADPAHKAVKLASKDPTIDLGAGNGSGDDPTIDGGSLRVQSTAGGFDDTYPLPAGGWSYLGDAGDGKGYKYKDAKLVNGPIKAVTLKNGKLLKATGKGGGLGHTLATSPDPVSVVLQTGTRQYCLSFGGTTSFDAGRRFRAKDAATASSCP